MNFVALIQTEDELETRYNPDMPDDIWRDFKLCFHLARKYGTNPEMIYARADETENQMDTNDKNPPPVPPLEAPTVIAAAPAKVDDELPKSNAGLVGMAANMQVKPVPKSNAPQSSDLHAEFANEPEPGASSSANYIEQTLIVLADCGSVGNAAKKLPYGQKIPTR